MSTIDAIENEVGPSRSRNQLCLARLAVLASNPPGTSLPGGVAAEVAESVGMIVAQATEARRAIVSVSGGGQQAAAGEFLDARLARLRAAAVAAIAAACDGDAVALRDRLRWFGTLAAALSTVQQAVDGAAGSRQPEAACHRAR